MNYIRIDKEDVTNGPGVRVVLWVSGCTCHCKGCHNPETWDFNVGQSFDEKAEQEIIEALSKPWIKGLTLSGGNPVESLCKNECLYRFLKKVKSLYPEKDIWMYSGWTWEQFYPEHNILWNTIREGCIDVIVDGPFVLEKRDITLPYRGSSNQRIIDVKKTLTLNRVVEYEL